MLGQSHCLRKDVLFYATIGGKHSIKGCVLMIRQRAAFSKERKWATVKMLIRSGKYSYSIFCPNKVICVGTLLCTFIICVSACNRHVPEMKNHKSAANIIYVSENEAFGYPVKRFLHPSVSSDDKWVTYHRSYGIDWSEAKFEDFVFHDVPDTFGKRIYYSRAGKYDEKIVPYPKIPKGSRIKNVGGPEKWSPDGRYFAYHAEIELKNGRSENRLVVIDFEINHPRLVENVKCSSYPNFYFIGNETYVYADENCQWLLKKRVGDSPQRAFKFKKRANYFQIGSNGNVIYRFGRDELYLDNFINPSARRLASHPSYTLSPDGKYVVFYTNKFSTKVKGRKDDELAVLVDLEKQKTIYKFIIKRHMRVSWSSDGCKIAFLGEDIFNFEKRTIPTANNYHHFVVVDIETMDIRIYPDYEPDPIIWFSDSKHIIYPQGSSFLVRNIETNAIEGIINNVRENGIWMTPSGKTIYWVSCLDLGEHCFFIINNPFHFNN